GNVRKEERAIGGYELFINDIKILQIVSDYPITPKSHGVGFLMKNRHLWLRSKKQHAILKIRAEVIKACREYLDKNGFINIDTPILTPAACEGTSTLFETTHCNIPVPSLTKRNTIFPLERLLYNHPLISTFFPSYFETSLIYMFFTNFRLL
ncbi:unnamed protein product, partial [marine sediment metagenome]